MNSYAIYTRTDDCFSLLTHRYLLSHGLLCASHPLRHVVFTIGEPVLGPPRPDVSCGGGSVSQANSGFESMSQVWGGVASSRWVL